MKVDAFLDREKSSHLMTSVRHSASETVNDNDD